MERGLGFFVGGGSSGGVIVGRDFFDFDLAFFLEGGHFSSLGDALMLDVAICGFRWGQGRIHMG